MLITGSQGICCHVYTWKQGVQNLNVRHTELLTYFTNLLTYLLTSLTNLLTNLTLITSKFCECTNGKQYVRAQRFLGDLH